jgi:hypothetical protein
MTNESTDYRTAENGVVGLGSAKVSDGGTTAQDVVQEEKEETTLKADQGSAPS